MLMVIASLLLTPSTVLTAATEPVASCVSAFANPRLPLGRLRDLPAGVVCPPSTARPDPLSASLAAAPASEPPVTYVVVHELRVRPSQVIIEPPQVHFVDQAEADAATPPRVEPTP